MSINLHILEDVFGKGKYKIKINRSTLREQYNNGWKSCNNCNYIAKTDLIKCPICKQRFRTRIRYKSLKS